MCTPIRADLLRRLGRHREAAQAYETALGLCRNDAAQPAGMASPARLTAERARLA